MSVDWDEYARIIRETATPAGGNLFWKIAKKNNNIDVQLWALDQIASNSSSSKSQIDEMLATESKNIFGESKSLEIAGRALILPKVLGLLYVQENSYHLSNAYEKLISEGNNKSYEDLLLNKKVLQVLSDQLEKFYYFNGDIFGEHNRHVDSLDRKPDSDYFHVYPIFFIYEVLVLLKEEYDLQPILSKFECHHFLFLAQEQSEAQEIARKINEFRKCGNQNEIEEKLKQSIDSRLFNRFELCIYFDFVKDTTITVNKVNYEIIKNKVLLFKKLIEDNHLIGWDKDSPEQYSDMLYSKEDLLQYHYSLMIKKI